MARFAWYTHLRRPRKCHDGGMDMLTIIQTERMKLKRKRVCEGIWALTALLLIFAIQRAFSLSSESRLMDSLGDLYALAFKNLTGLYLPIALGILATSVFFDERKNDTLKELLIVPVTRAELYFSKAAIVLLVSISQCFFTYVGATLGGLMGEGLSKLYAGNADEWFCAFSGRRSFDPHGYGPYIAPGGSTKQRLFAPDQCHIALSHPCGDCSKLCDGDSSACQCFMHLCAILVIRGRKWR